LDRTLKPPRNIRTPKSTTMCIKSFFLDGSFTAKYENEKTAKPIKDGIKAVGELVPLISMTRMPQVIKKSP
tara:strand:+ start:143 stop:355 length:213 start_codon:yes stop_codon:yes gene_type:complete